MSANAEPCGESRLSIEGRGCIERAAELRKLLLPALRGSGVVVLDLSKLVAADASFIQLLCSFHKELRAAGADLRIEGNGGVSETLAAAGLGPNAACVERPESPCVLCGGGREGR